MHTALLELSSLEEIKNMFPTSQPGEMKAGSALTHPRGMEGSLPALLLPPSPAPAARLSCWYLLAASPAYSFGYFQA